MNKGCSSYSWPYETAFFRSPHCEEVSISITHRAVAIAYRFRHLYHFTCKSAFERTHVENSATSIICCASKNFRKYEDWSLTQHMHC